MDFKKWMKERKEVDLDKFGVDGNYGWGDNLQKLENYVIYQHEDGIRDAYEDGEGTPKEWTVENIMGDYIGEWKEETGNETKDIDK